MLHTFFKVALLSALTASLSLADDFLARATNGALSDNSVGVKKLTADEASKVVGGYYNVETLCSDTQCYAFADHKTTLSNGKSALTQRESVAISNVTLGDPDLYLGYMVQKVWDRTSKGNVFAYFTYAAVVLDGRTGKVYQESNLFLNNNLVVLQLSNRYKDKFDKELGGLYP